MKRALIALAVVGLLGAAAFVGQGQVEAEVARSLQTELIGVELNAGPDGSTVEAIVRITNGSRFAGSFESLAGDVVVGKVQLPWTLSGLEPGAVIEPGAQRAITVSVPVDGPLLLQLGVGAVLRGGVELRFDGTLVVGVFGVLRVPVEVHDARKFSLL